MENGEKHDENDVCVLKADVVLLDLNNLLIKTLLLFKKCLDLSRIKDFGDDECLKLFVLSRLSPIASPPLRRLDVFTNEFKKSLQLFDASLLACELEFE
jgi:hypothetical protein